MPAEQPESHLLRQAPMQLSTLVGQLQAGELGPDQVLAVSLAEEPAAEVCHAARRLPSADGCRVGPCKAWLEIHGFGGTLAYFQHLPAIVHARMLEETVKENRTLQLQIEHCRERLRQRFLQQEIAQHRLKARLAGAVVRSSGVTFQRFLLPEPPSQVRKGTLDFSRLSFGFDSLEPAPFARGSAPKCSADAGPPRANGRTSGDPWH